jgi:hypothetical protein
MRVRALIAAATALLTGLTAGALASGTPAAAAGGTGTWTVQVAPLPTGVEPTATSTTDVSCGSDALCALTISATRTAAGQVSNVADMLLDGALSTQLLPAPGSGSTGAVGGVSCALAQLCFTAANGGIFDTYTHASWTAARLSSGPPGQHFTGAACSPARCLATGYYVEFDGRHIPYVVDRDNTTGTLTGHPVAPPALQAAAAQPYRNLEVLFAPACAPTGECYALGYASPNGSQFGSPYLVYRSGSDYHSVRLPVPNGVSTADLKVGALSCAAATDCATIGTYLDAQATHQYLVAEVLRGGVLESDPIPIPRALTVLDDPLQPRSIDCPAIDRCVGVVGFRNSAGEHGALLVRYDGTHWQARVAPAPAAAQNADAVDLTGVSCPTISTCVATGGYLRPIGSAVRWRPLVETWAGGTWTAATPSAPADLPAARTDVSLSRVSCGRSRCLADGTYTVSGTGERTGPIVAIATGVTG